MPPKQLPSTPTTDVPPEQRPTDVPPDQRPSTPTKDVVSNLQSLSIQSTPYSHGSSDNYSYQSQNHQSHYKPYLAEDLKHRYTVSFDDFLQDILHLPRNWMEQNNAEISSILEGKKSKFKDMVSKYKKPVGHETHRYPPFIELANYVVNKLGGSKFLFCRNDDIIVRGSDSSRKPDVVVVCRESLEDIPERSSVDNLMNDGPKEKPFWWTELLSFWEFKLIRKDLTKSVERDLQARDRSSTVVPSTSKSASKSGALSSESKSRQEKLSPTTLPSHPMTTRSSSSSSKRPSPTASGDTSQRPKKQKVEDGPPGDDDPLPEGPLPEDPMLQCASYALELLSNGGLRSHVIGALVTDDKIELLYYDRSIVIVSEPLNFLEEERLFVAMLKAVASLEIRQWGYSNLITAAPRLKRPRTHHVFKDLHLTLHDGTVLRLVDTVFRQHCLIGRGTCVVQARRVPQKDEVRLYDEVWNGNLIVKLSRPAKTRTPEYVLIEEARSIAEKDDPSILNHLPKVLHHEDVEDSILSQELIKRMGGEYEGRVLRIIVQEELYPITQHTTAKGFGQSFREIFKCYRWLYEIVGIIHRDVSVSNMMLRKEGDKVYGVLNDFDLAVRVKSAAASSMQRTGTKPFMAIDLLLPGSIVHGFRHDLESMFYDLVWITSRFENGKEIKKPPLQEWANYGGAALAKEKRDFIIFATPVPRKDFMPLWDWIFYMHEMIRQGFFARITYLHNLEKAKRSQTTPPPIFNEETLGGFVTFEKFEAILDMTIQ